MPHEISPLEALRIAYRPRVPRMLAAPATCLALRECGTTAAVADAGEIRRRFPATFGRPLLEPADTGDRASVGPLRVGVVLSGGQAPGGHNVIAGLLDGARDVHPDSVVLGFSGGPKGVLDGRFRELTLDESRAYRNTGGFDWIGAGRDKIETPQQLEACRAVVQKLGLDGLVVVGGDDSNTNAAVLAEYFLGAGLELAVVGVPKTIDGDLKSDDVEISFGFDTATRVYSELIGNICRDARSAGKYWHFIKLMGRSASHVTLECVLQTRANVALIAEEVRERGWTLDRVVDEVAEAVRQRAAAGRNYGVCLVPEGLIEFIPEMAELIAELNEVLHAGAAELRTVEEAGARRAWLDGRLSEDSRRVLGGLPEGIRQQLLLDRDSHGNVQVSKIETEALLLGKVRSRLAGWTASGSFSGNFQAQNHFLGYEGRCAAPTNFDAAYTNALGRWAAALVALGRTGYMASMRGLSGSPESWTPVGVPLTAMMQLEQRKGRPTPVIAKALVRTDGAAFGQFAAQREESCLHDRFVYPGPIQYLGPPRVTSVPSRTLLLERTGSAAAPDWLEADDHV